MIYDILSSINQKQTVDEGEITRFGNEVSFLNSAINTLSGWAYSGTNSPYLIDITVGESDFEIPPLQWAHFEVSGISLTSGVPKLIGWDSFISRNLVAQNYSPTQSESFIPIGVQRKDSAYLFGATIKNASSTACEVYAYANFWGTGSQPGNVRGAFVISPKITAVHHAGVNGQRTGPLPNGTRVSDAYLVVGTDVTDDYDITFTLVRTQ